MMNGKLWIVIALFGISIASCAHRGQNSDSKAPVLDEERDNSAQVIIDESFLSNFRGLSLIDSHSKPFNAKDLVGHTTLVNFIFTHCDSICPTQTKGLTGVYGALTPDVKESVRFVSISIDPQNDDPAQLQAFAKQMGADKANWSFLTGSVNDIEQLVARLHIFDDSNTDPALRPQIHRTSLWLIDSRGRMLQRYKGDPPDQARLIKELTQVNQMALTQAQ